MATKTSAWVGSLLGLFAIVGGQLLEGGSLGQLAQGTAALIVLGGTLGATLLAFPGEDVRRAFEMAKSIYLPESARDRSAVIREMVQLATVIRRDGLLAAEPLRKEIKDPLLAQGMKFVIEGFDSKAVSEIVHAEMDRAFHEEERAAEVFEGAGGYAPTVGILGAVLGLIHVMSMLNEPSKIGEGIAVAFVATVYGVALANLVLLPWGSRLKRMALERFERRELVAIGLAAIQEGLNPQLVEARLRAHLGGAHA